MILLSPCSINSAGFWFISKFSPTFWFWSRDPDVILIFYLALTLFPCVSSYWWSWLGLKWLFQVKGCSEHKKGFFDSGAARLVGKSGASFWEILQYLSCIKPRAEVVAILDTWMLNDVGMKVSVLWKKRKNMGFDGLCVDSQKSKSFSSWSAGKNGNHSVQGNPVSC